MYGAKDSGDMHGAYWDGHCFGNVVDGMAVKY